MYKLLMPISTSAKSNVAIKAREARATASARRPTTPAEGRADGDDGVSSGGASASFTRERLYPRRRAAPHLTSPVRRGHRHDRRFATAPDDDADRRSAPLPAG